jgi:hypothetical protein
MQATASRTPILNAEQAPPTPRPAPQAQTGERVAVTGSRQRTDRHTIERAIAALPKGTIIITGGCEGPDLWAEAAARSRGLRVETIRPDLGTVTAKYHATLAYHARNGRIVESCDRLIAFPTAPHGGTWHTVKAALAAGKRIEIIPPPCPIARLGQPS